jgi:hypothetical protein
MIQPPSQSCRVLNDRSNNVNIEIEIEWRQFRRHPAPLFERWARYLAEAKAHSPALVVGRGFASCAITVLGPLAGGSSLRCSRRTGRCWPESLTLLANGAFERTQTLCLRSGLGRAQICYWGPHASTGRILVDRIGSPADDAGPNHPCGNPPALPARLPWALRFRQDCHRTDRGSPFVNGLVHRKDPRCENAKRT